MNGTAAAVPPVDGQRMQHLSSGDDDTALWSPSAVLETGIESRFETSAHGECASRPSGPLFTHSAANDPPIQMAAPANVTASPTVPPQPRPVAQQGCPLTAKTAPLLWPQSTSSGTSLTSLFHRSQSISATPSFGPSALRAAATGASVPLPLGQNTQTAGPCAPVPRCESATIDREASPFADNNLTIRRPTLPGPATDAVETGAVAPPLRAGLLSVIASSSSDGSAANSDGSSSTASLRSVDDDDDEDDDAVMHASSCALRSKTVVTRADEAEYDDDGVPLRVNTLEFVRPLGHGAAGTVYHCIDTATDEERAVKVIPRRNCGRTGSLAKLPEVAAMKDLQHPNIVRLYECIDDVQHGQVLLVMDYVNGGCVATMRDDGTCERLPVDGVALVLRHAASALVHCHSRRVVHGDLKPDNIMMDRRDEARPRALLADFGVATTFYKPVDVGLESVAHDNAAAFLQACASGSSETESTSAASGESRHAAQMMRLAAGGPTTTGGTPAFSPPEVLQGGNYTTASDMWALGVTAFCLLFGRLPFDVPAQASLATLKRVICDGEVHYPAEATMDHHLRRWRQALQRMLAKDPSIRLTALELSRCKLLYPHLKSASAPPDDSDAFTHDVADIAQGDEDDPLHGVSRGRSKTLRRFHELALVSGHDSSTSRSRSTSLFFGASSFSPPLSTSLTPFVRAGLTVGHSSPFHTHHAPGHLPHLPPSPQQLMPATPPRSPPALRPLCGRPSATTGRSSRVVDSTGPHPPSWDERKPSLASSPLPSSL